MRAQVKLVLVAGLAFLAGGSVGFLVFGRRAAPGGESPIERAERESPAEAAAPRVDSPTLASEPREPISAVETPPAPREPRPESSQPLISEALRAYALAQIRAGWNEVRGDAIGDDQLDLGERQFEQTVKDLPRAIGRKLGEDRSKAELLAEDARHGGAVALLTKMAEADQPPVVGLVSDAAAFEALFQRDSDEREVRAEGLDGDLGPKLEDGKTYTYPAGCYRLQLRLYGLESIPRDVTIAGAGMDKTLLVLQEQILTAKPLRRFGIRDCTIFTNDNYLLDQRDGVATVVLERVRVVGFDMGAGSSCALGVSADEGLALLARDCRFEGGYGRHPEHGQLFRADGPALAARFERCRIDLVSSKLEQLNGAATMVFDRCSLSDLLDWRARFATPEQQDEYADALRAMPNLALLATTVSFIQGAPTEIPRRDLNQLFPGWQQQIAR